MTLESDVRTIFVVGATGKQGGAVSRALLQQGWGVRALVRDPASEKAQALIRDGVVVAPGDLEDRASVVAAAEGSTGVFSVQTLNLADRDAEVRQAQNIAWAAQTVGATHLVHSSVSAAAAWSTDPSHVGEFMAMYHTGKAAAEAAVKDSGVARVTILRPAVFMENLLRPSMYFPAGPERMVVAVDPDVPVAWVAVDDIGTTAVAAFSRPDVFDGVTLELAGDMKAFRDVASVVSEKIGTEVTFPADADTARREGLAEPLIVAQQLMTAEPAAAHPDAAHRLGLTMTPFGQWWIDHQQEF